MYGYKPVRGLDRCLVVITLIPTTVGNLFLKRAAAAEELTLTWC